jgi:hypothetical protein
MFYLRAALSAICPGLIACTLWGIKRYTLCFSASIGRERVINKKLRDNEEFVMRALAAVCQALDDP